MKRYRLAATKASVRRLLRRYGWRIGRYDWESSLTAFLAVIFDSLHIDTVIDVGAHRGEYGQTLREMGYNGHILSFEPVRANYEELVARAARDHRWHAYPFALGSKASETEINVLQGTTFSSFLSPSAFGRERFPDHTQLDRVERAAICRLDEVLLGITKYFPVGNMYLKMDTQGWDLEVFEGAERCLDRIVALQSELSLQPIYEGMPHFTDALGRFGRVNYRLAALFPVSRNADGQLIEADCVLLRDGICMKSNGPESAR